MIRCENCDGAWVLSIMGARGNLLGLEDIGELRRLVREAAEDAGVRGIVLTGEGRSFSAGLDLKSVLAEYSEEGVLKIFKSFDELLLECFCFPKPFVAAVNGHSVGAGFLLQLCADYVVVHENEQAKLGLPELNIGLTLDELMCCLLNYAAGSERVAQSLVQGGELMGPGRVVASGLADEAVSGDLVMGRALEKMVVLKERDERAFGVGKRVMRKTCAEQMKRALERGCFGVFGELLGDEALRKRLAMM